MRGHSAYFERLINGMYHRQRDREREDNGKVSEWRKASDGMEQIFTEQQQSTGTTQTS